MQIGYQSSFTPQIFGLQNNSALCYLNSLIQSLISCPSFNYYLLSSKLNNKIVDEYLQLYKRQQLPDNLEYIKPGMDDAFNILRELNAARRKSNVSFNLSLNAQEDVHEGLLLLLDSIGGNIEKKFQVRYKSEIFCKKCKNITTPGNSENYIEPPELVIDLSEEDITSKEHMEQLIKRNIQVPKDYKCEKCGAINTDNARNIIHVYSLVKLSEILVIIFKKYTKKKNIFFPEYLDFKTMTGELKYRLVAQIEHSGNTHGGHYQCKCLRVKPKNFHLRRKLRAQELLKDLDVNNVRYKRLQDIIIEADKKNKDALCVFSFDDEIIRTSEFEPTPNSYLLFYHYCRYS